jgi:DNA repair protein RecO (recombination protein O)
VSAALEGIVVGSVDFGDADRIVRVLSSASGRVPVLVRRARSRSGAATSPGTALRVAVSRTRDGLHVAKSVEVVHAPVRARDTLGRIALLAYGCELCGALAPEGAPAPKLHGLLASWLQLLEGPDEPGVPHRVALEAKACAFAGFAPALTRCAVCHERLDDPAGFDADAGGALHARCGSGVRLPAAQARAIDALLRTPLAAIPPAGVGPLPTFLLTSFVEHHLGRALHSRALLALP